MTTAGIAPSPTSESRSIRRYVLIRRDYLANVTSPHHPLIHHAHVGSVSFHGAAWLRPVYFGLLVPHIVLAALVVPLALTTIHRAWRGHFDRHRRLARVTLPIWLYVSVSGVLVYILLSHSGR